MQKPIPLLKTLLYLLPPFQKTFCGCLCPSYTSFMFLSFSSAVSCGFLSSLTCSFIICGDFNVHVNTDCIDQQQFSDLLDSSNLVQSVNKLAHFHGHILDLILHPSDSNFVSNVTDGDLVSDHALVKCRLDFACP